MLSLDEVIITADLARRPSRPPDYEGENRALLGLMDCMAGRLAADEVLQKLVEAAMSLCKAQSAGMSLLERDPDGREIFRWRAAAGKWSSFRGEWMPRVSPCGTVIDRDTTMLMAYPERHYSYNDGVGMPISEALLTPFHAQGDPIGTVWVLSHDGQRRFDNEDRRLLSSLARVAAGAYQLLMQERLATDLALTERLQEISTELLGENQSGALYPKIVDAAALIMRSDFASIQVFHPERGETGALRLLAHRGFSPEAEHHWEWVGADSVTSCGGCLRLRSRVIVPDVERDELIAGSGEMPIYRRAGIRAMQTTPLIARDGKMLGVLSTHWRQPHQPGERDLRLLDVLARQAADLIERSLSVEHSRMLLDEINHRAKNMLAVVQAMVRQTARKTDPDSFVRLITDRLAGLAASQDLLVRNDWHGVELADLLRSQLAHLGELLDSRVGLSGPSLRLTPGAAQTLGMALHELGTNAVKYGALSNQDGRIEIAWSLDEAAQSRFVLAWREKNGPPVAAPTRRGFGCSVMVRSVEHALDAEVDLAFAETGLSWTMVAPVAAVAERSRRRFETPWPVVVS
ncbi:MAG TPA: GAF domain-containing protein [Magnetospirillaceae bacterium]|nr:GAF domain-containing protein [Magnetospirillaceae bacterium]